jgi:hypothetical protein
MSGRNLRFVTPFAVALIALLSAGSVHAQAPYSFYETTLRAPRVNNTSGQVTAVIVSNTAPMPVTGAIHLLSQSGTLVATVALQLEPHATLVSDLSQSVAAFSGSLIVAHDGPYGSLVGKVVALEPATGFSFDTPLAPRPR